MAPLPEQYVSHESLCTKEYCFTVLNLINYWWKVYKNRLMCWVSTLPIWILQPQTLQWTISEYPQKIILKKWPSLTLEWRVNHQAGRSRRSSWLLPIGKEALRGLSILDSKYYKPMWMTALECCGNNVKVCFNTYRELHEQKNGFIFW